MLMSTNKKVASKNPNLFSLSFSKKSAMTISILNLVENYLMLLFNNKSLCFLFGLRYLIAQ